MAREAEEPALGCACCGQTDSHQPRREAATLSEAALDGDVEQLQHFIRAGADVCAADASQRDLTALHHAVESGSRKTVRALIDAGANVSAQTSNGVAPLHTAAANGHYTIVQELLDTGANVSVRNENGGTPLHAAAMFWQPKIAKLLLDAGADVQAKDHDGRSPLYEAVRAESLTAAQLLLDAGADANATDSNGDTLLEVALADGPDSIKILLDHGAMASNKADRDDDEGNTLLHRAAQSSAHLLRALLATATPDDLEAVNNDGATPFLYAAAHGSVEQLRLLQDAGANVKALTAAGETALHLAAGDPEHSYLGYRSDAGDKLGLIIDAGVDLNARAAGLTALGRAEALGHGPVIQALRERGATE
ncbi:hypothetical protein NHJ13051_000807 [Beauveria bassiana]